MYMVNIWSAPRFVQLSDKLGFISFGKRTKTDDKLIDETDYMRFHQEYITISNIFLGMFNVVEKIARFHVGVFLDFSP